MIVFAECGLLIGFFLPGDTLLFTAGRAGAEAARSTSRCGWSSLLSLRRRDRRATRSATRSAAAAARRCSTGPTRGCSSRSTSSGPSAFFDRYGPLAIVLGRFVPVVRTFITVMAGAGRMNYRTYTIYTVIGGVLWAAGVTMLGYFLGNVAFIADNIELLLLAVVACVGRADRVRAAARTAGESPTTAELDERARSRPGD